MIGARWFGKVDLVALGHPILGKGIDFAFWRPRKNLGLWATVRYF